MAITKTNFINYARCPRFVALSNIKKDKLDADVTYASYKEEEIQIKIEELLTHMYEEDENGEEIDLIDKDNPHLEAMMKYYKMVEEESSRIVKEKFGGTVTAAENTKDQKLFEFLKKGIRYLCYIDIYNETEECINIIEVKATTTNKFMSIGPNIKKEHHSIFERIDNILYLKEELNMPLDMELDKYNDFKDKLFRPYEEGKQIYDLTVQRYIIEEFYKSINKEDELKNFKYYLAVLNHEYVFDGTYENDKPIYRTDENGNELISFIDLTNFTKQNLEYVKRDVERVEKYIFESNAEPCKMGIFCEYNKQTKCKFFDNFCGSVIPKYNSSLSYMRTKKFKTEDGTILKGLDIINENYIKLLDIPESWIKSPNHFIQRKCLKDNIEYIDKDKIDLGLSVLEYPVYHLDFETFPCPVPRFKGEKPYTQSPFEFSLHIEHAPGVCDKEKDNIVFLARTFKDEREELIKQMLMYMDSNKGTLFAQNVSFEKSRIKELANVFPDYKTDLMKLYNRGFDLQWLVKTNTKLYEELGLDKEKAEIVNYYNNNLSGSYSIKKTLPVFSNLKYDDLDVKNGTEAIIEYANYPIMSKEEFEQKYKALVEYCKQDTWAMVVILNGLRKLTKDEKELEVTQ